MDEIKLKPIGYVSSPITEKIDENWGIVISRILLKSNYAGALSGLEDFSHAIIITYLHQSRYEKVKHLQRRPRNLVTMPKVGIFAQRSKDRPNPIGITVVEILGVGNDFLEVKGLDAIDETPVLDIKPYYPYYDKIDYAVVPEWVDRLMKKYF
jgi:tRNA-Thr(GGU) m(6)t(6)A37 methyltransferase TsaA